ncbi:nuclear transport factor 2 family protein [Streptomyces sp. NPDC048272]|uniref:nuclear transport factor 2 family protein n=1 Tax=Streptomyces sp. NPDC048272 TaxID=3154616 RepID=UPI0034255731
MEPLSVVARLWERIEARDWDGVSEMIAEDAVIEWPVSSERIVGRANFIAVLSDDTDTDEGPVEVLRILADGDLVVTEVEIPQDHVATGPSPCGPYGTARSWAPGSTGPAPDRIPRHGGGRATWNP